VDCSHPDDQVDLLVSYLMAMEFVHDLNTDANSQRLQRLKKKQKEYAKKSSALLHEIRESDPKCYIKLAEQVEANLTQNECMQTPDELGSLDTFRFEADTFLNEAMSALEKNNWNDALKLAKVRLPVSVQKKKKESISNTFWLQQDRSRLWLWEWIDIASNLGIKVENTQFEVLKQKEILKQDSNQVNHEQLTNLYGEQWWPMDQLHRKFSSLSERYLSTHSDLHIKAFIEIRRSLYGLYRNCIDEQSYLWNAMCEQQGFLPKQDLQQRNFFSHWVKPLVDEKKKTAVLFVDALRYELGHELVEQLQTICGKLNVSTMLSELPSITSVGMNALIPVVNDSMLTPLFDKKMGITGFQGGQRQVKSPEERQKTLQDYAGVETSWIPLHDLLSFTDRKLKKYTDKELMVVTALDIDKMGESGALSYGLDYFENGMARLKTAAMKLKEKGFQEFIITSDHGFLLGDESLETGKATKLENVERRHAFGSERNSEHLISVNLQQLNYTSTTQNADNWLTFERSTHLLINQSRTSFYHGGNTLQERLVPVIAFSFTQMLPDNTGTFSLTINKLQGLLGFHRISIEVQSNNQGMFSLPQVELQMLTDKGDDIDVEIGELIGAQRTGDFLTLPVDNKTELVFKLKGNASKARLVFKSTQSGSVIENGEYHEFFEVENYTANMDSGSISNKQYAQKSKTKKITQETSTFSENIPEEFYPALAHLEKHGSLTEKFLVNTLGSNSTAARKARRFANKLAEWLKDLPFDIYIEQTAEGKE